MRKPLFIWCLLCIGTMLALAVLAESNNPSSDSVSQKVAELNRRVAEAQREGDSKALQRAMRDYERFLDEHPELKTRLAEMKAKDQQICAHRTAARKHVKNERYLKAAEEYEECLKIMAGEKETFAIARANVLVDIGKLYQSLADEKFRLALKENISPEARELMQARIDKIKKNVESGQGKDHSPRKP